MNIMDLTNVNFDIRNDLEFAIEALDSDIDEFSSLVHLSKATIYDILSKQKVANHTLEKIYSYIYKRGYRINSVKAELLREVNNKKILFHGSKEGLTKILTNGSRNNCDFGAGFYLGETYNQAVSFVCENENSSVYSFAFKDKNLKILNFKTDLEWMLAICYYRRSITEYEDSKIVSDIKKRVESADLIIAPIADNRMFYIMSNFAQGEINVETAVHSLSASKLGLQYVFKSNKALKCLEPISKYYLSQPEKDDMKILLRKRSDEIETKLKMAKREFRNGLFIDEVLK